MNDLLNLAQPGEFSNFHAENERLGYRLFEQEGDKLLVNADSLEQLRKTRLDSEELIRHLLGNATGEIKDQIIVTERMQSYFVLLLELFPPADYLEICVGSIGQNSRLKPVVLAIIDSLPENTQARRLRMFVKNI